METTIMYPAGLTNIPAETTSLIIINGLRPRSLERGLTVRFPLRNLILPERLTKLYLHGILTDGMPVLPETLRHLQIKGLYMYGSPDRAITRWPPNILEICINKTDINQLPHNVPSSVVIYSVTCCPEITTAPRLNHLRGLITWMGEEEINLAGPLIEVDSISLALHPVTNMSQEAIKLVYYYSDDYINEMIKASQNIIDHPYDTKWSSVECASWWMFVYGATRYCDVILPKDILVLIFDYYKALTHFPRTHFYWDEL